MLRMALLFLIIALFASVFHFYEVAFVSAEIARLLFVVFLLLFVISLAAGAARAEPPV